MDIARGEATEKELDALIRRRHDQRVQSEGERAAEELWVESERKFTARRREQNRIGWFEYEMRLYRIHRDLACEHLARAEMLETNGHHHEEGAA